MFRMRILNMIPGDQWLGWTLEDIHTNDSGKVIVTWNTSQGLKVMAVHPNTRLTLDSVAELPC